MKKALKFRLKPLFSNTFLQHSKSSIILISTMGLTLLLVSCNKQDYLTWNCTSEKNQQDKLSFILEGSKIRLKQETFNFCGSLGSNSFFDGICPALPENASITFNIKKGWLSLKDNIYLCESL
ncbi:MAG: hypothetical protein WCK52_06240 [Betaproteobacteria bacterium]